MLRDQCVRSISPLAFLNNFLVNDQPFRDSSTTSVEAAAFQKRARAGNLSLGRCPSGELMKRPCKQHPPLRPTQPALCALRPEPSLPVHTADWQQGSASWDNPENTAARKVLRAQPRVQEALDVWWSAAVRNASPDECSADGGLLQAPYCALSKRVYKAATEENLTLASRRPHPDSRVRP